ncbi:Ribosomal RNA large subunit methyltransferase N [Alteracholeplasma palmae J233]|uniref:Probable dual-specificity RNA methyltransferase RlmN n=1 Tax=Alteracholeplasma palmae (strain ATCC 49389 / J233) TaxID=1318466 RepID=U4KKC2_ALTPJ|nr:23S rRNA (adenine(2503)-C(2))-methyltransferase RlmN [Alteracholeplasma palmae]CCV63983.1 Ribosomal RNA large subunit methyltransferase N [Alteracholeplasma palmae J233]
MLIYGLTYEKIENFLLENEIKSYRAMQIWEWLYRQKVSSFDEMANLPKDLIELLKANFTFDALETVLANKSEDGTIKYLYGLKDEHLIETVLMNHNYGRSICVTTQVGCNIGCSFCASGVLKKKRDLTAGEIVAQIVKTEKAAKERISSIVVMGIGEPFDNFNNLKDFLSIVNHPKGLAIGARHITVSTSGLVPKIKEFAHLEGQFNLAISLHAPNDEVRSSLMQINKRFPINEVIGAIKYYISVTNRRVTIEYILIQEVNDSVEHAKELAALLKGMNVYVNLIPYNAVKEADYVRSELPRREAFYEVLKNNRIQVTLRKEQGHDINAACGQLRSQHL